MGGRQLFCSLRTGFQKSFKIDLLRHFISAIDVLSWPSDYKNAHVKSHQDAFLR